MFDVLAQLASIRTLMDIAAIRQWQLFQLDGKNTFPNDDLEEKIMCSHLLGILIPLRMFIGFIRPFMVLRKLSSLQFQFS